MKKTTSIILIISIIALCFTACGGNATIKNAVTEGSIFGGASDDKIKTEAAFDITWLTKGNNKTYNPDLAQFCSLLAADSYFREKDLEKQRQNRVLFEGQKEEDYSFTSFLSEFGFTDAEHYESYLYQEDGIDTNDSVTLNIGHQTDGKNDIFAVVVRGCFSAQEWRSAFDPGCAGSEYETLTGAHPDWTNKDNFKGVDIAATRALSYITDYMKKTGSDSLPDRILITGHSRGGGIANILGAYFEKDEAVTSYTYTFNSMAVTYAADAKDYKTIFNVFDSGDMFTALFPFANGSFTRYGTDKTTVIAGSDKLTGAIAELKGRDDYSCIPAEEAEKYSTLFAQRFTDRDVLCEKDSFVRSYGTQEEAQAAHDEMAMLISNDQGLGLEDLCKVGEIETNADGSFSIEFEYCDAALLRTYAMIFAYGETAYTPAMGLFAEDETACEIASVLFNNISGLNSGHLLVNDYVITKELK